MHVDLSHALWIALCVDLWRAFLDCVCICGSIACISGLFVRMWNSQYAFVDCMLHVDLSCAFLYRPVDLLRAFVDCVCECGSLTCICGGFDTVFTPYFL